MSIPENREQEEDEVEPLVKDIIITGEVRYITLHAPSLPQFISYRRDILPGVSLALLVEFGPVMVSSASRRIMCVFNTYRNLAGG